MNAVIACGGTGGHLFPGIAVAEALQNRGHEVMLLVSEKDIDAVALSGRTNFQVEKLPTVGLPSPFSPAFFEFTRRFVESLSLCRSIYRKFKPHAILGMGGFTSTAPVLAGRFRGVPTFIHESNAVPGKAEPLDRAGGECRDAGLQGMRAVFSKNAHRNHRHTGSHRPGASGPRRFAAETRIATGPAHTAGDGRQSGRQRN